MVEYDGRKNFLCFNISQKANFVYSDDDDHIAPTPTHF